jgi:hypothetical protein
MRLYPSDLLCDYVHLKLYQLARDLVLNYNPNAQSKKTK